MAEIVPKSQLFVYMFKFRHFHRICLGSSYAHAKNQGDPMSNSWVNAPQFSDTWSYDTQGGRAKSKTLLWYNIHWYTGKRHPKIFLRAMIHDTQGVEPSAHPPLALRWPRPPRASPSAGHSLRRPRPPPAPPSARPPHHDQLVIVALYIDGGTRSSRDWWAWATCPFT